MEAIILFQLKSGLNEYGHCTVLKIEKVWNCSAKSPKFLKSTGSGAASPCQFSTSFVQHVSEIHTKNWLRIFLQNVSRRGIWWLCGYYCVRQQQVYTQKPNKDWCWSPTLCCLHMERIYNLKYRFVLPLIIILEKQKITAYFNL